MIILRLLLLLTNLHLKLLSTQGTGADKLLSTQRVNSLVLSNLSAPVPCVLSNFRCKLVKSNSSLKIIITLKVFNIYIDFIAWN